MLKLRKVEEPMKHLIEFDIYVPIKIRVGHWDMSKEHTIYWRTGDFEKSLIEIGLGSETGILRSFTLTEAAIVSSNDQCIESIDCETIEGTPIFDISGFPSNGFLDCTNQFNVYLGQKELLVSISMNSCIRRFNQDRFVYWFDSNDNLISVRVTDITSEEMYTLRQGLQV